MCTHWQKRNLDMGKKTLQSRPSVKFTEKAAEKDTGRIFIALTVADANPVPGRFPFEAFRGWDMCRFSFGECRMPTHISIFPGSIM